MVNIISNMSKRFFCNCHWSRQVSYLRHCWNKIFFLIIRITVVINQTLIMSPFIYLKNSADPTPQIGKTALSHKLAVKWKFCTQRLVTAMAIFLFISYSAASPFMVKMASELYSSTRRKSDQLFVEVAKFNMTTDVLCALLVMASNIWYRENIVKILNLLNELLASFEQLDKNFVGFIAFLALTIKTCLTTYDTVMSLPHLATIAYRLSTQSIVGFLFTHYLHSLGCIFELNMFIFTLLFLTCSLQLEKELQCRLVEISNSKMSQLISLQNSLQKLTGLFRTTFQFGIFLMILLYFVTILCNIYAMLDFYVTTHVLFSTFITFLLSMIVELYSFFYVTYLFDRSQQNVKDLFLYQEELCVLKDSPSLYSVQMDVLWPQLNEFRILGLFTLNNEFALFLLTYSINFIVIILEFEINKASEINN